MSLNNIPSAERLHIGIFGKRHAGKSRVINALTGQNLSIVSDIKIDRAFTFGSSRHHRFSGT